MNDTFCFFGGEYELPKPMTDFLEKVERMHGTSPRSTDLLEGFVYSLGFDLHYVEDDTDSFAGFTAFFRDGRRNSVLINSLMTTERKRFTVGHELGHVILGEKGIAGFTHMQIESVCDEFSARLLVPDSALKSKYQEYSGDPKYLADYFEVSYDCARLCIASRM